MASVTAADGAQIFQAAEPRRKSPHRDANSASHGVAVVGPLVEANRAMPGSTENENASSTDRFVRYVNESDKRSSSVTGKVRPEGGCRQNATASITQITKPGGIWPGRYGASSRL